MSFSARAKLVQNASTKHLGEPITFTPAVGDPVTGINGVWANDEVTFNQDGTASIGPNPEIDVKLSDLGVEPSEGEDKVTVFGIDYLIATVIKDGQGMAKLLLTKLD